MTTATKTVEHAHVLQAVQEIGEAFASTLQLQPVLERIIYAAMQLAEGDAGSVMLLTEDQDWLVVQAAIGPRAEIILGQRQRRTASIAGQALLRNQPILLKGRADGEDGPASSHPREIGRSVVVPLVVTRRLLGVLNVNTHSEVRELSEDVVQLLGILANQAAIMIEHARLYEDLREKEQRLEHFVDRVIRENQQRRSSLESMTRSELQEFISKVIQESAQAAPRPIVEEPSPLLQRLTQREQEVLHYIVQGLTNKEIASQLFLSPDTVKNHVVHIMEKLGAQDRTQAAVFAIRNGLVK